MSSIKEKLLQIKSIFNTAPPSVAAAVEMAAPVVPVQADEEPGAMEACLVGYAIDGGTPIYTDISDDNVPGLDANDYVFTDETMATAYPDGVYNVTGTDFGFTVAAGQIVAIVNPSGSGAGLPIPDVDAVVAPVTSPIDASKPVASVAPVVTPEAMKQMYSKQADLKKEVDELKLKLAKQESFSTQVLELVEMLANTPTGDAKTIPEPKRESFNTKKEANLMKMAEAIKLAKSTKKIS